MPRPRKQKPQPPLRIEINFDADLEGLLFDPETADARHLKVTIQDRKLRPKTLKLLPPAEGELNRVSPVRLRAGTDVYPPAGNDGVVEFRAELDVDAIEAHWGEVEKAVLASPSGLPFRFSVGIEKQSDSDPDPMERPGLLTINLNSIHWIWQPLIRDENGDEREDGPPKPLDTPIEVPVDGTDTHGFKLRVELQERQKNGQYAPREADFTHYLSPDHKVDFDVLAMKPPPWELVKGQDGALFHQPETRWWTKPLRADSPVLGKLPLSTTVRVQAWAYDKIQKRFPNTFEPKPIPRYAIREIPLNLNAGWEPIVAFEPKDSREYSSIKLEEVEFVADNDDMLKFTACVRRKNTEPEQLNATAKIEVKLDPEDPEYELRTEPADQPGKIRGTLRSAKPLFYVAERAKKTFKLKFEITQDLGNGQEKKLEPIEKPVKPRLLYTKLWVVPGAKPGTSEAGAIVCLDSDATRPVAGQLVEFEVANEAGGAPQLRESGVYSGATNEKGTAARELTYSGMTWDNLAEAQFKVSCRLRSRHGNQGEATFARINVRQNMHEMLMALGAAQESLRLTNPNRTDRYGDWILPNSLRGPAYNLYHLTCRGPDEFTCGNIADRIFEWWAARRFGEHGLGRPEKTACMNGIEIAKYTLAPIHVFAGCYPSGGHIVNDPWFMDPWWRQEWGDHTLLDWKREFALLSAAVLFLASPLAIPLMAKILAIGTASGIAAMMAAIKAWLIGSNDLHLCTTVVVGGGVAGAGALHFFGYDFTYGVFNGANNDEWLRNELYRHYRQRRRQKHQARRPRTCGR